MQHSFPNIRIGLMVGIGGSAPSAKYDIRLGDIVVSTPGKAKGGVFQYDSDKTVQGQIFQFTRFLDQPPRVLSNAVSMLQVEHELEGHQIKEKIDKFSRSIQDYNRSSNDRTKVPTGYIEVKSFMLQTVKQTTQEPHTTRTERRRG
jgi:hypothetical protein